jgi:hypothetical protein
MDKLIRIAYEIIFFDLLFNCIIKISKVKTNFGIAKDLP